MKRFLLTFTVLALSTSIAASFNLQGAVKVQGNLPSNARVGALLMDRSGKAIGEIGSSAVQSNGFVIAVGDATPPANALVNASSDALDWPGLVGKVTLTGNARIAQAVMRAYGDADNTRSYTNGDATLESFVTKGRGGVVMVYSEAKLRIQADKGFDVTLEPGWNLVQIELGKSIEARRVSSIEGLQLEVFGR